MMILALAAATETQPDYLGPILATIGVVIVALIQGVSVVWRRRQDRRDAKEDKTEDAVLAVQPKVIDGWEEVRKARAEATTYYNLYRTFENLFYLVQGALRHLVRSVRDAHPDQEFAPDVVEALAAQPPDTDAK